MKKLSLMMGSVIILIISIMFTGCKDKNKGNSPSEPIPNQFTVNSTPFKIQQAVYVVESEDDEKGVALGFLSSGTIEEPGNAVAFYFSDLSEIPVGTFNFASDDLDTYIEFNGFECWIISGELTIAKSDDIFTISVKNTLLNDSQSFTLNYQGKIELYIPEPDDDNYFTFGEEEFEIVLGGLFTQEIEGKIYTGIVFLDNYYMGENVNTFVIAFEGEEMQIGTFALSLTSQPVAVMVLGSEERAYLLNQGFATIQKSGDIYTVDVSGKAVLVSNPMAGETPATCHFEGNLEQFVTKNFIKNLPLKR